MLRVSVLCPDLTHSDYGLIGNARVARELLRHMKHKKLQIFALSNLQPTKNLPSDLGYALYTFPGSGTSRSWLVHALRYVRKLRPDIVHGHGGLGMALTLAAIKKFTDARCVLTLTALPKSEHRLARSVLSEVDVVICLTHYVSNFLQSRRIRTRNLHVIPYGLNERFLQVSSPKNRPPSSRASPTLCFWGDGTIDRGFGTLLASFSELIGESRDIRMVAAVRTIDRELAEQARIFIQSKKLVVMSPKEISWLPEAERYPVPIELIVASGDLVVLPYWINPMEPPLTLVESMALAKPVITTDRHGNSELIGSNERGILVRPGRTAQLTKAILSLLLDGTDYKTLGNRARAFISNYFDDRRAMKRISAIYEELYTR